LLHQREQQKISVSPFLEFVLSSDATQQQRCCRILEMVVGGLFSPLLPLDIFRLILQYLFRHDLEIFEQCLIVNQSFTQLYREALFGIEIFGLDYALDSRVIQWLFERHIVLSDVKFHRLDEIGCDYISKNRLSIQSISLYYGQIIIAERLAGMRCPNLTSLKMNHVAFEEQKLLAILQLHPQLLSLELFNCKIIHTNTDHLHVPLSSSFASFLSCCSNLRHLDLSSNDWFTDELVEVVVRTIPHLQSISLSDTAVRQDQSLIDLLNAYPGLHTFSFSRSNFQSETIQQISRHRGPRRRIVSPLV
jgi:hypothetical protein